MKNFICANSLSGKLKSNYLMIITAVAGTSIATSAYVFPL